MTINELLEEIRNQTGKCKATLDRMRGSCSEEVQNAYQDLWRKLLFAEDLIRAIEKQHILEKGLDKGNKV